MLLHTTQDVPTSFFDCQAPWEMMNELPIKSFNSVAETHISKILSAGDMWIKLQSRALASYFH